MGVELGQVARILDGKVARVLNPFEVVANLGREHGIVEGQRAVVYALGDEVADRGPPCGRREGGDCAKQGGENNEGKRRQPAQGGNDSQCECADKKERFG